VRAVFFHGRMQEDMNAIQTFIKKYKLLLLIIFWLAVLFIVGTTSQNFSTFSGLRTCSSRLYSPFYRWDSSWYTQIAQKGYKSFSVTENSSIAYWPLYPATIWLVHEFHFSTFQYTQTFLSVIYAIAALLMLYKLARLDYDERKSLIVVAVTMFFPAAYFFVSGYPESLFLLLVILSFYFARKEKWFLAGLAAGLLALTKPYGVLIVPALFFEYWVVYGKQTKIFLQKFSWGWLILPILSVIGFMIFNFLKFGNALAFLATEQSWGRSLGNPFASLYYEAKDYVTPPAHLLTGSGFPYLIYVASVLLFLWALKISFARVRKSYLFFTILVMLVAFLTGTLTSWDRYMMTSLATLIGIGTYLSEKKNYILYSYLIISFILFVSMASLFVRCFPVE
jgi:Dolichyl-phosphate-mannose-protein mannosyltransferase